MRTGVAGKFSADDERAEGEQGGVSDGGSEEDEDPDCFVTRKEPGQRLETEESEQY